MFVEVISCEGTFYYFTLHWKFSEKYFVKVGFSNTEEVLFRTLFHIIYLFICPLRVEKRAIILRGDFSNTEETLFLSLFYSRDFTFIYVYTYIYAI